MTLPETSRRRASLSERVLLRGKREATLMLERVYLYLIAVPVLMLKGVLRPPFSVIRGYASLLLLSEITGIKLAVSGMSTIDREYENYLELMQRLPELSAVLPHFQHSRGGLVAYLQSERLYLVEPADALSPAIGVYRKFSRLDRTDMQLTLEQCPQISSGLRYIETIFDPGIVARLRAVLSSFLKDGRYHVGLAHGDFHSRNIMRDRTGCYRVIDLDCVRFEGIKEFDALYFLLEQEWSATRAFWTQTLAAGLMSGGRNLADQLAKFEVIWSDGLAIAYFLDRVGQDYSSYGVCYTMDLLEPVIEVLRAPNWAEKKC